MTTTEVTEENFQDIIGQDRIVIVDFWATWCGAWKAFAPVYEAASEKHADVVFGKVNTEVATRLSDAIGIRALDMEQVLAELDSHAHQPGHVHS